MDKAGIHALICSTKGAEAKHMVQISRRDALLASLTLPGIIKAAGQQTAEGAAADKPKRFEEVAGFEVSELASRYSLAILPLGSLEFHGPHNPLGSDFIIISGIAERTAARTNGVLFPTLAFTQCPAHT